MQTKRYEGSTLQYLAIEPDGYDPARKYPMIILLHGFGAHMGDLAGLAPAIDAAGYVYICPNAPIPFQIGPSMTGFGWTPAAPPTLSAPPICLPRWWTTQPRGIRPKRGKSSSAAFRRAE